MIPTVIPDNKSGMKKADLKFLSYFIAGTRL